MGNNYCIDNVPVLHDSLKNDFYFLGENYEYYYGLFLSVYYMPNIILPLLAGILMVKFGVRLMYVIFSMFILTGQCICSLGCYNQSIFSMIVGRIIFGFGGECIRISQNIMIAKWFFKSNLGLPFGLVNSVCRLSGVLNNLISPMIIIKVKFFISKYFFL